MVWSLRNPADRMTGRELRRWNRIFFLARVLKIRQRRSHRVLHGSIYVLLFKVLTVNLDFAFVLARRRKIIGDLHSQPRLSRAAEGLR
jgi:hypothetical protein